MFYLYNGKKLSEKDFRILESIRTNLNSQNFPEFWSFVENCSTNQPFGCTGFDRGKFFKLLGKKIFLSAFSEFFEVLSYLSETPIPKIRLSESPAINKNKQDINVDKIYNELSDWLKSDNKKPTAFLVKQAEIGEPNNRGFYGEPAAIAQWLVLMVCGPKKYTHYANRALQTLYRIGLTEFHVNDIFLSKIRTDVLNKYT